MAILRQPHKPPLTKIIATVGPSSADEATLRALIEADVAIFRLNFSHGTLEEHAQAVARIRRQAAAAGRQVAILGDLQGPKIRIGSVTGEGVDVQPGEQIIIQRRPIEGGTGAAPLRFSTTYDNFVDDVKPGERVLINDGQVRTLIVEAEAHEVLCAVTSGGRISTGKGVNLPDSHVRTPAATDRDAICVAWAVEQDLDFLALSFVRSAREILDLRDLIAREKARIGAADPHLPIVAKIEHPAAVRNIESIVDAADAIMVARGDLGVEMELAQVPVVQKQLIAHAQDFGKPCIVATQMLESMIHSTTPTRAEVSDVATAIFAGVDAVMLSGETAVGRYPTLAVDAMVRTAHHTERHLAEQPQAPSPPGKLVQSRYRTAALAHGAFIVAADYGAKFIAVWSQQGGGARLLSQNNFSIPILAFSSDAAALRRMQMLRGVTPAQMPVPGSLAEFTRRVDDFVLASGWAVAGERCLLMAGSRLGTPRTTNALAVHEVGNPLTGFG